MLPKGQGADVPGHVRLEEFQDEEGAQRRQANSHGESLQNDAKIQENRAIPEEQLPWAVRAFNRYRSFLWNRNLDPAFFYFPKAFL
jgi:hypothetical protein